jgi:hypothetical protein
MCEPDFLGAWARNVGTPHRAILLIGAADEEHAPSEVRRDDRREERSTSFADEVIE